MIELGTEGAVIVVGFAAVIAVGWAANLSVRSALRGPAWALTHLRTASRVMGVPVVLGAVLLAVVDPVWVGLAVLYVAVMVWFLSGLVRRNLIRMEDVHGFEEILDARRTEIVAKARRLLLIAAGGLSLVGLAVWGVSGAAGVVALVMAAVLVITALTLG